MMKNTYFKKVVGILMVMLIVATGITLFNEIIIDEIEDLIYPDEGRFDLGDFTLGVTCVLSLTYSMIRIMENIFRKEEKRES